jgi:putative hydrolase of the HAD superfamily
MESSPVRAVLWDFGGVLVRTEDPAHRRGWEQRLGLFPGDLPRLVFDGEASQRAMVGQGSSDDVWRWVGLQLALRPRQLAVLRKDFFRGDRIDQSLVGRIRSLRPGRRTALISNAWPDLRPFLTSRYPLADAFDTIVISGEEGVAKPAPEIFHRTLGRLGVPPSEAVLVDDMETNVAAARELGLRGIQFRSADQAWGELEQLLRAA